jgi:hypothetical protein
LAAVDQLAGKGKGRCRAERSQQGAGEQKLFDVFHGDTPIRLKLVAMRVRRRIGSARTAFNVRAHQVCCSERI